METWAIQQSGPADRKYIREDVAFGYRVAEVYGVNRRMLWRNAHLIAAAPRLYHSFKRVWERVKPAYEEVEEAWQVRNVEETLEYIEYEPVPWFLEQNNGETFQPTSSSEDYLKNEERRRWRRIRHCVDGLAEALSGQDGHRISEQAAELIKHLREQMEDYGDGD
jgi:hypothetical protein